MATTTNYSWETPDDTDLVKDGAAAIRTLGSSIDTTTKALNPSTTLGDIEYRSSTANTNTRLGIGTTGQILTVAGGVPTWATAGGGGGMTLLSTTTLSGNTTISSISTSYKDLVIHVENWSLDADGVIKFRVNNQTSGYQERIDLIKGSTNAAVTEVDSPTAQWTLAYNTYADLGSNSNFSVIHIPDYASTSIFKVQRVLSYWKESTAVGYTLEQHFGGIQYSSAINEINFFKAGGNINGGTVKIYGVN